MATSQESLWHLSIVKGNECNMIWVDAHFMPALISSCNETMKRIICKWLYILKAMHFSSRDFGDGKYCKLDDERW